jgi:hypothetical protein
VWQPLSKVCLKWQPGHGLTFGSSTSENVWSTCQCWIITVLLISSFLCTFPIVGSLWIGFHTTTQSFAQYFVAVLCKERFVICVPLKWLALCEYCGWTCRVPSFANKTLFSMMVNHPGVLCCAWCCVKVFLVIVLQLESCWPSIVVSWSMYMMECFCNCDLYRSNSVRERSDRISVCPSRISFRSLFDTLNVKPLFLHNEIIDAMKCL